MEHREPVLRVIFYRSDIGIEPVREWLKKLRREERKAVGEDIKTAQFGWPLGMPLIRKIEKDLWEVRSNITGGIARTFLHGRERYHGASSWVCQEITGNSAK